jgi:nucleotide-binding universal stress UspA family protein
LNRRRGALHTVNMSKPILVGYDPRMEDHAPVRFGMRVARFTGAPLVVALVEAGVSVTALSAGEERPYAVGMHVDDDLMVDCTQAVEDVEAEVRAFGVRVECVRLQSTSAARALHEEAERQDAGLLVVGSSRRGEHRRLMLGSTAERLIHGGPCPISVVPHEWMPDGEITTIGAAYVDSEEGREALRSAHALARRSGATLRVISVVKEGFPIPLEAEAPAEGRFGKSVEDAEGEHMLALQRRIRAELEALGGDADVEVDVMAGDPADVLIRVSENLDLLVCGSRGYGPLRAVLLGSVSSRVATEAACPVVVLPRGVRSSLDALMESAPSAAAR